MRSTAPLAAGARLRQQQAELVAAHPAGEVVDAGRSADQAPDRHQRGVPGRVALLEVEPAKAVDVEQRNGQRALVALRAGDVELELGSKGAEAQKGRDQGVSLRQPGELGFELRDPLASGQELIRRALPIPPKHLGPPIGAPWRVLEPPGEAREG